MPQAPGDPRVGTMLAGYRVGERIGRGGMGVVHRAEHVRLGRASAIKVLAPEVAGDPVFRERFEREARIAAALRHPSVVTVYDAGEADGVLYLAMQLVEGGDLAAELAAGGALSPDRALGVGEQVAGALDAAHAAGLIHRDVKPANVLLDRESAYLADFGLVRFRAARTRPRDLVGTVQYIAPEQIEGRELDGRADQYALAALLFHALCGSPPFERESDVAVLQAHLREPAPAVSSLRAGLPAGLDAVLARGLEKAPADRFESCGALVAAARAALDGAGPLELAAPRIVPAQGDEASVPTLTDLPQILPRADGRLRVVLAGVDPQTRALAGVALGGRGDVEEVGDGDELVAAARATVPDLILLDWAAPGPGAAAVVGALRAAPATRSVPVVLVVDWQAAGDQDVRAAGADDTLETPFSPLQLQVKLRRLLGADAVLG